MSNENNRLKPSPNCKCSFEKPGLGELDCPVIYQTERDSLWLVSCGNCDSHIPDTFDSPEEAQEAWNEFATSFRAGK